MVVWHFASTLTAARCSKNFHLTYILFSTKTNMRKAASSRKKAQQHIQTKVKMIIKKKKDSKDFEHKKQPASRPSTASMLWQLTEVLDKTKRNASSRSKQGSSISNAASPPTANPFTTNEIATRHPSRQQRTSLTKLLKCSRA